MVVRAFHEDLLGLVDRAREHLDIGLPSTKFLRSFEG